MTPEQLNAEIAWYSYVCRVTFVDVWETIVSIDSYSSEQQDRASAEIAYYHERGKLPLWATMIERVDVVNGSRVFVHADVNARV